MSDSKYNFPGQVNAGAIGDQAQGVFIQKDTSDIEDIASLVEELRKLREIMRVEASNPGQFQALVKVAEAEEAAKSGNKSKALEALQAGGKWTFDMATKVGTSLVSAYLKTQLGL